MWSEQASPSPPSAPQPAAAAATIIIIPKLKMREAATENISTAGIGRQMARRRIRRRGTGPGGGGGGGLLQSLRGLAMTVAVLVMVSLPGLHVEARRRHRHPPPPPPDDEPLGTAQVIQQKAAVAGEKYNYDQALYLSLLFYEAQRSGRLPENNRIPWRRDSNTLDGLLDVHLDLSGGYNDAGDYIKFGWPMAFATTTLAWGFLEYEDSYRAAGELDHMYDCIKWPLDWLLKAHVEPNRLFVQIGDGTIEHKYWGRPEFERKPRPAFEVNATHPGTEPAADAAAAMAAGFLVFKDHDPIYASELLHHAKQLFDFASSHLGTFTLSAPYYESHNGYQDELAWAAVWLYKATGDAGYLTKATNLANALSPYDYSAFGWDSKNAGVHLLMYKLTKKAKYADIFKGYMTAWTTAGDKAKSNLKKTPKGLVYYMDWGPLRWAANTAFLALLGADYGLNAQEYRRFARAQVHYVLGDNDGYSYMVGFGDKFPRTIHSRGASCGRKGCVCDTRPSANVLYGAIVGGPDENDMFLDDCRDYQHTEASVDYNACFQSAVAGLKHLSLMGVLGSF